VWGTVQKPETTPNRDAGKTLYNGCGFGGWLVTTNAGFNWLTQAVNARVEPLPQEPEPGLSGNSNNIEHRLTIHRVRRARAAPGESPGGTTTEANKP